jgi:putative transposase
LTAKRDKAAAMRFFDKAMQANGIPQKVTIDKSGTNKVAIDQINESMDVPMIIRQENISTTSSNRNIAQ